MRGRMFLLQSTALLLPSVLAQVQGDTLSPTANEMMWEYKQESSLAPGGVYTHLMGSYQGMLALRARITFTRSAAASSCGGFDVSLQHKCGAATDTVVLSEGTCGDCSAGVCQCEQAVVNQIPPCDTAAEYTLLVTNTDSAGECAWSAHETKLFYTCGDGYFGAACMICDDCTGCSCHGSATSQGTSCLCSCAGHWTGERCDECPSPFTGADCDKCMIGYKQDGPDNCYQCTVEADCSNNAVEVTSDAERTQCICTCRNNWLSLSGGCDFCPPNYKSPNHADANERNGDCDLCVSPFVNVNGNCQECDIFTHCTNPVHADSVVYNNGVCECSCKNGFSGGDCATCPPSFTGSACDKCAAGYIVYPTCTQCTSPLHCSNHASEVTSTGGDTCTCTCRNGWTGTTCESCPPKYAGNDCDICADGFIGTVALGCEQCTSEQHCNGHAVQTAATADRDACLCVECANEWTGATCATCPSPFGGDNCNQCLVGYINFPDCTRCTNADHCGPNAHAGTATSNSDQTKCVCTCKDQWTGDDCNTCDAKFDQTTCDKCAHGLFGFPECYACSNDRHCSSHATAVELNADATGCVCTCDSNTQWTGADCGTCPPEFESSNCAQCSIGRVNYPHCRECLATADCNNRASAVTSNSLRTKCRCTCNDGWMGDACDTCPSNFDQSGQCNRCATGFVNYPACFPCSLEDCGGPTRATESVANPDGSACVCTCLNKWDPTAGCTNCPHPYTGHNCDACKDGFVRYPECVTCTTAGDCSGHASSVTSNGDHSACVCSCDNHWSGSFCETCSPPFGGDACNSCVEGYEGTACDSCASGYILFPSCTKCPLDDCNGRGVSVASNPERTSCICTCTHAWGGATCNVCPQGFAIGTSTECDGCADGFVGYPNCRACSVADDCGGSAKGLTATSNAEHSACTCECHNKWSTASSCQECPSPYGGVACDTCASGFHNYPTCEACTNEAHCRGRAAAAPTSDGNVCQCDCDYKWTGPSCGTCPPPYAGDNCNTCLGGRITYPECRECTVQADCSGHARSAGSDAEKTQCVCDCLAGYGGADCSQCAAGYRSYPDCVACLPDSVDCNGRADTTVPSSDGTKCVCQCSGSWTGDSCQDCSSLFDQATCSQCAEGRVNYPTCRECTVASDCSPNAFSAVAANDGSVCRCVCKTPWSGATCASCPAQYTGEACDSCAEGFSGTFPVCDRCTSEDHCSSNADGVTSVTADDGTRECRCACRNHWQNGAPGTAGCSICPAQFAGLDCESCAVGHVGANCDKCTAALHCSGNAADADVTDDGTRASCVCSKCFAQWTGDACQTCPSQYDSAAGCARCAAGHIGFPDCRECTVAADCLGNALAVNADDQRAECVCSCRNRWSGLDCGRCEPPYAGSDCETCASGHFWVKDGASFTCSACTNEDFCGGLAREAEVDADGAGCVCLCPPERTGVDCSQCAVGYFASGGNCVRCSVPDHCSGNARGVDVNAAADGCTCDCVNQWTGDSCGECPSIYTGNSCSECAAGRVGYPNCAECSVASHCSNHATDVSANADKSACACECHPQWAGDSSCSVCTAGYAGDECTKCDNNLHFSGRCLNDYQMGASVDRSTCVCGACRNQWSGDSCDVCASNYGGNDCQECAAGYVSYPSCVLCTVGGHCTSGADAAVEVDGGCQCQCRNHWSGSRCGACRSPYAGADCDRCEDGSIRVGSDCVRCSSELHCNSNAASVTSNAEGNACVCTCRNKWSGPNCDVCALPYGGNDCDKCADNRVLFDTCVECTVETHCSSRATSVAADSTQQFCVCDCDGQWTPAAGSTELQGCSQCPGMYAGDNCERCAPGRAGYPACHECTLEDHCHNNAEGQPAPTPDGDACVCSCSNKWAPPDCLVCPLPFGGPSCAGCAEGYIARALPELTCIRCTIGEHCSSHASTVTVNADQSECVCNCLGAWEGSTCDQCPPRATGENCDKCAPGRVGFPACTECTTAGCSQHAISVTADENQLACICECRNKWTGDTCATCPTAYAGSDCDKCSPGRINYPDCTPCLSSICNNHGLARDNEPQTACVCLCDAGYTGPTCSGCALGYVAGEEGQCNRDPASWCTDAPGSVEHTSSVSHCVDTPVGGTCAPECIEGYHAVGYYTCEQGAEAPQWANTLPTCQPDACAGYPAGVAGSVALTCNEPPVASGEDCTPICAEGYQIGGSVQCQNGGWTGTASCTPAPCTTPPTLEVGALSCTLPVNDGTTCTLTCPEGYTKSGDAVCSHGGWNEVECVPDSCSGPPGKAEHGEDPKCTLPASSGAGCELTCERLDVPKKCASVEELDMNDLFIAIDGSHETPSDHKSKQAGPKHGVLCFEWVPLEATRDEAEAHCRSKGGHLASIPSHHVETNLHSLALSPSWWLGLVISNGHGNKLNGHWLGGGSAGWWNSHYNDGRLTKGECCGNMRPGDKEQKTGKCLLYDQTRIPDVPYEASECERTLPFWCMYEDGKQNAQVAVRGYQKSANYKCSNGKWSEPTCTPAPCDAAPPAVAYGTNGECNLPAPTGSSCSLTCNEGFEKVREHECILGNWVPGQCRPQGCNVLPDPVPHGKPGNDCQPPFAHGHLCAVQCDDGFATPKPFVCRSGAWTGPDACVAEQCVVPPPPLIGGGAQGVRLPVTSDAVVTIKCLRGLTQVKELKCERGAYVLCDAAGCSPASGGTVCAPEACTSAPAVVNANPIDCGASVPSGTICDVSCKQGFRLVGALMCNAGQWSEPECEPLPCSGFTIPDNAFYSCRQVLNSGDKCRLRCNAGFVPTGADWQCLNGEVTVGTCEPQTCNELPRMPQGGVANCNVPAAHGATCSAAGGCRLGREPTGDFVCQFGKWEIPQCAAARCQVRPPLTPGLAPAGAECETAEHNGKCTASCVAPNEPGLTGPWVCNDGEWLTPDCAPSGAYGWMQASCCSDSVPRGASMECTLHMTVPTDFDAATVASRVSVSEPEGLSAHVLLVSLSVHESPAGVSSGAVLPKDLIVQVKEWATAGGRPWARIEYPSPGWIKARGEEQMQVVPVHMPVTKGTMTSTTQGNRLQITLPFTVRFSTEGLRTLRFSAAFPNGNIETQLSLTVFALALRVDAPLPTIAKHWSTPSGTMATLGCDPSTWHIGKAFDGNVVDRPKAATPGECCKECHDYADCHSWNFNSGKCLLTAQGNLVDAPGSISALRTHADAPGASDAFSGPPAFYANGEGIAATGRVEMSSEHPLHWSAQVTASRAWGTVSFDAQAVPAIADDGVAYHWTTLDGKPTRGRPFNGMLYVEAEDFTEDAEWYVATAEYPSGGSCWRAVSALQLSSTVPQTHGSVTVSECGTITAGLPTGVSGEWTGVSTPPAFSYVDDGEDVWLGDAATTLSGTLEVSPTPVLPLPKKSCITPASQCTAKTCNNWGWCDTAQAQGQSCDGHVLLVSSTGRDVEGGLVTVQIPVAVNPPTQSQVSEIAASAQVRVNQGPGAFTRADVIACGVAQSEYPDNAAGCRAATPSLLTMLANLHGVRSGPEAADRVRRLDEAMTLAGAVVQGGGSAADDVCCSMCNNVPLIVDDVLNPSTSGCPPGEFEVKGAGHSEVNGCYRATPRVQGEPVYALASSLKQIYKADGLWRIGDVEAQTSDYVNSKDGLLPPHTGWVVSGGAAPTPTVVPGGAQSAPELSSATQERANNALTAVLGSCRCGASCGALVSPTTRKALPQQINVQTNLNQQSALSYVDRMHTVLANGVRRREPGSTGSITSFTSPSGEVTGKAVADTHGTFRGGRKVESGGVEVTFSGEKLPFGSKEAGEVYTVSIVIAKTGMLEAEVPNPDGLGFSVYTVKVWSSDSNDPRLGNVEVEISVRASAKDSPADAPLRTLRQGVWGLPEGCTDLPPHAVRCPAQHVPGTWAIRLSTARVPTPLPPFSTPSPPVVATPAPPVVEAPTPYPPGSVPFMTPKPYGTHTTPTPKKVGEPTPDQDESHPKELMVILAVTCAALIAVLSALAVLHWRRRTLAKLEYGAGKHPGKPSSIAALGTGMGYGDLTGSPADTSHGSTGDQVGTRGSDGTFATAEAATEPTARDDP
eukprot:Hpha_TRINITY_DN15141_c0_g7::TRINITY_DN15141_c0_g7_i1::g.128752::m.128752